jgi:hypothetical protein
MDDNRTSNMFTTTCHCQSVNGTWYDQFLDPYFRWIDLLAYAIIPFLIMAICTFMITRVLFLSNKRLNKNKSKRSSSTAAATTGSGGGAGATVTLLQKKQTNVRANKAKHLTYTLIVLNCLFFCLVSPLVIILIYDQQFPYRIVINIVYSLAYSNHSFNFVLYGVSSPPFRETLFNLLGIKPKKKNSNPNVIALNLNKNNNAAARLNNNKNNNTTNTLTTTTNVNISKSLPMLNSNSIAVNKSMSSIEIVTAHNGDLNNNIVKGDSLPAANTNSAEGSSSSSGGGGGERLKAEV